MDRNSKHSLDYYEAIDQTFDRLNSIDRFVMSLIKLRHLEKCRRIETLSAIV